MTITRWVLHAQHAIWVTQTHTKPGENIYYTDCPYTRFGMTSEDVNECINFVCRGFTFLFLDEARDALEGFLPPHKAH